MAKETSKGYYTPENPAKYIGDINNVRFMSSWELDVHKFLDRNPHVVRWGSEIVAIPYFKRMTGRMHKYYTDYYVKYRDKNGLLIEELWEVKPYAQTKEPKNTKRKKEQTFLYEKAMYETNIDKWSAAQEFCNKKGIQFRILTEKDIFI